MLKKIALIFVGLLGSLIILELSMQAAGFVISNYQNYKNNKALKNKSQYTIMCIGESTTYSAYTDQMQKILNKKYPNKFSIIDCGIPAIKLDVILKNLDANIDKYKPDIAVCMMGVNSSIISFDNDLDYGDKKYGQLKLYKLYKLLQRHLISLLGTKEVYADNIDNLNINYVYELYAQKKYVDAEQVCARIIEIDTDDYDSHAFLAMLYYYNLNKKNIAYKMALNIVEADKKVSGYWKQIVYEIVIDYNVKNRNNNELVKRYTEKLISDGNIIFGERLYVFIKDLITPEQKTRFLEKMYFYKTALDQYYGLLAIESMDKKDHKKTEEYFSMAEDIRVKYASKHTYKLYKLILKKLIDNNIKVICMQYPVRSIESLKNILKNESYYNEITFVSNEQNFKQLLKENKYNEIFKDQFAGDFGHCTGLGNTTIAENLINSLEELLNL